jgi:hypothetical protein
MKQFFAVYLGVTANSALSGWVAYAGTGNTKANGREPKRSLGQVYNFKLGCFCCECNCTGLTSMATSRVENSVQVLYC